ncbi:MAG: UDP-3-O-acyl-N-acetylglucosamine deacetylase [Candidatus Omnitrophica bacterium]|nr:UDP-3-O-acyl-N-acetylglucosamine deacetylase [Candidatus Omnitrophota bacterium]
MAQQTTIKKEVSFQGKGLHTAHKAKVTFKPAPKDTGLIFVRTDLAGRPQVKAEIANLLPEERRSRRTSIGNGPAEVHTVEHILATVLGLGIDNLLIEIDNDEFPGEDGSSKNLAELLLKAGMEEQPAQRRALLLKEPIFVSNNDSQVIALPAPEFKISYTLDYPAPLNSQFASFPINRETFLREIAPARTFCLQEEVDALVKSGLGKGSNYNNTIVIGEDGAINNTLRFKNEMVRHKILDLLGDIGLLGAKPQMHVVAVRSGHNLNVRLVNKLIDISHRETAAGVISPEAEAVSGKEFLEAEDILKIIPHRHPFLFVDRILKIEDDNTIIGLKNVSINEPYFAGHFPDHPVMPGVILIETMAQVAACLMLRKKENRNKVAYFAAIDNARFRNAVLPGDQLLIKVALIKFRTRIGQVHAKALVNGKVAAEADLMFALLER